jgi:heat shock protein HslJ
MLGAVACVIAMTACSGEGASPKASSPTTSGIPNAPLLAGGWNVTSMSTGAAVQSPATGSALTLEFVDGRTSGNSGCNTFDGPFEVSGIDGIALGPFRSTRRACADPVLSTQEQQYRAALELARTYRVTGEQLTLFRAGGTIAATFDRARGLTSGS